MTSGDVGKEANLSVAERFSATRQHFNVEVLLAKILPARDCTDR